MTVCCLLPLVRKNPNALLLDVGCGCESHFYFSILTLILRCHHLVGHDTRKVVLDGFPVKNVIASDISHGKHSSRNFINRRPDTLYFPRFLGPGP
jgi:hypothetical protein